MFLASTFNKILYIWDLQGNLIQGFPIKFNDSIFSSPLVMDLNNNSFLDIVVGANNGIHVLIDIGVGKYSPWPMFRQNSQRTGSIIVR